MVTKKSGQSTTSADPAPEIKSLPTGHLQELDIGDGAGDIQDGAPSEQPPGGGVGSTGGDSSDSGSSSGDSSGGGSD